MTLRLTCTVTVDVFVQDEGSLYLAAVAACIPNAEPRQLIIAGTALESPQAALESLLQPRNLFQQIPGVRVVGGITVKVTEPERSTSRPVESPGS